MSELNMLTERLKGDLRPMGYQVEATSDGCVVRDGDGSWVASVSGLWLEVSDFGFDWIALVRNGSTDRPADVSRWLREGFAHGFACFHVPRLYREASDRRWRVGRTQPSVANPGGWSAGISPATEDGVVVFDSYVAGEARRVGSEEALWGVHGLPRGASCVRPLDPARESRVDRLAELLAGNRERRLRPVGSVGPAVRCELDAGATVTFVPTEETLGVRAIAAILDAPAANVRGLTWVARDDQSRPDGWSWNAAVLGDGLEIDGFLSLAKDVADGSTSWAGSRDEPRLLDAAGRPWLAVPL